MIALDRSIDPAFKKDPHSSFLGDLVGGVTQNACFGNEACKQQRQIDMERQRLELDVIRDEMGVAPTQQQGLSTGALVGIVLAVLVFVGLIIYFTTKKK